MRKIIFVLFCFSLACTQAFGQRLIDNQPFLTARFGMTLMDGNRVCLPDASLSFGKCTHYGKWFVGASYYGNTGETVSGLVNVKNEEGVSEVLAYQFGLKDQAVSGEGGYSLRIVSNRKRSVVFWGTLGAHVGCRLVDIESRSPGTGGLSCPKALFEYGFYPQLSLEMFPAKSLSLSLYARTDFRFRTFAKNDRWFNYNDFFYPQFGIGLTYYFFLR